MKDFRKKFFTDEKFRRERTSEFALVELSSSSQKNRLLDEFGTFRMTVTKQLIAKIKECCKSEKEEE